jgi:hypothetical protein
MTAGNGSPPEANSGPAVEYGVLHWTNGGGADWREHYNFTCNHSAISKPAAHQRVRDAAESTV